MASNLRYWETGTLPSRLTMGKVTFAMSYISKISVSQSMEHKQPVWEHSKGLFKMQAELLPWPSWGREQVEELHIFNKHTAFWELLIQSYIFVALSLTWILLTVITCVLDSFLVGHFPVAHMIYSVFSNSNKNSKLLGALDQVCTISNSANNCHMVKPVPSPLKDWKLAA